MKRRTAIAATAACCAVVGATAASASAAITPPFEACPGNTNPAIDLCVAVQSKSGSIKIKNTTVPVGDAIRIEGGLRQNADDSVTFVPPTNGTGGVNAKPISVPGGLLGFDLPLSFNMVDATAQRAGGTLVFDPGTLSVKVPIKLHLTNPLLGPNCYIGSNAHPISLNLITGTTTPPPPNTPISGRLGDFEFINNSTNKFSNNLNVDNSFSVPTASGCALGLGLVNAAVNLKLGLPSAAGQNTSIVNNDVYLAAPGDVGFGS